ncbi:hypothetical protein RMATCC62417_12954 [Rhizopus microsporus]|nr:hypothetical protein RMATCC62417_12954 [Rhizopus microsporus]
MQTQEKQRLDEFIATLNEQQKKSVLSESKILQILAGPGSGKTRVLTCRVAYLVIEKGISPKNIVVVTFTNKAANEMRERLVKLLGEIKTKQLLIGTFHKICCRLLRRHAQVVNLQPDFTIADNSTSEDIINNIRKDKSMDGVISDFTRRDMKAGAIFGLISKAKSEGINAKDYAKMNATNFKRRDISILYLEYEAQLQKLNLVDFDSLLMKCCELLRKMPNVLDTVKCILIDEYQDTNIIQYDLIKLMMQQVNERSVTIVGDPDQSIFGWRSAEPKNFGKMAEEFKGTEAINMEQNYRSTTTILDAALHIIKQDPDRIEKSLFTDNPRGIPISIISVHDHLKQSEFVASEIRKVVTYSKGLIQYKDIAILMRMNYISNDLETAFRNHKIPYVVVGGDRFFNRMEVKDIISYLDFIYNPSNVLSFQRIINVPKRGIGAATLKKILEMNESQPTHLLGTLRNIVNSKSLSFGPSVISKLKAFVNVCEEARSMIEDKQEVADILRHIVDSIHYQDYLKNDFFADHEARWANVGELLNIARERPELTEANDDFLNNDDLLLSEEPDDINEVDMTLTIEEVEQEHVEPVEVFADEGVVSTDPVADFLEFCSLCSNQKEQEEAEGGKVTIATIHASKGLEWPCVFIVTCVDGVIPHAKADANEEGRLLYVGMTRSKFLLYCVTPRFRQNFGDYEASVRSRFLDDMDKSLYVTRTPEWDNDVRTMLAATIGKPIPPPDDSLSTKNKGLKAKQVEDDYSYSQPVYSDIRFGINGNKVDLFSLGGFSSAMSLVDSQLPATQKFNSKKKTTAPASSQPIMSLFRMNKTTAPKRERLSPMIEDPPNNQKKAKKEENEDDALLACLKEEDDFF